MDKNAPPSIESLYDALKYFRNKELNFGDYLSTGYRQLNELIIGLYPCLIVVAGRPGMGKSAGAWPGNSGGPVIDKQSSKVIGILMSGFEGEGKGITFAVKIDQLINDEQLQEQKIDLLK
ncbi:DnaB-like helicase C-terminal domain-containing protein [Salibacteraceae bacterium]|nr:DnaB-like helicase C-terminal domain-containing protein [Salibacteraceae bacterium]